MTELRRVMGFWDLVLFYIVTGFSIRWIATAAATGPGALTMWAIACVTFFIPLAVCVLRLSALYPDQGGLYVWTRQAFGEFSGFITGWNYWGSNLPYFPTLLYFAAGTVLYVGGWQHLSTSPSYFILFSVTGLAIAVGLSVMGLNVGKWLHNLGALGGWIPALLLIGLASLAWSRFGSATEISLTRLMPTTDFKDVLFWSSISFAFSGLEGASFMAGEIRDVKKILPRAVIVGGVITAILYMVGTAAVLVSVPAEKVTGLQGFIQAVDAVTERAGGRMLVAPIALLVSLGALGGLAAWFAAAARIPFVAGVDHVLPEAFGRLHPKWGTPYVAIMVQAVVALVFVLLGQAGTTVKGAYEVLISMSVITYFIPYLLMFAALIKLDARIGSKLWGGLGLLTTAISIVLACIPAQDDPNKLLTLSKTIGLTIVMLGVGAVLFWSGRRKV